jgi:hypothetical protein
MGKHDRRNSMKMKRRKAQAAKKTRAKNRKVAVAKPEARARKRAAKPKAAPAAPPAPPPSVPSE